MIKHWSRSVVLMNMLTITANPVVQLHFIAHTTMDASVKLNPSPGTNESS